jgi:hypothetical protein
MVLLLNIEEDMSRIELDLFISGIEYSFWIQCLMFNDELIVFVPRYITDLESVLSRGYNE